MKIYIGADHRGFELKQKLKQWLLENGHEVDDLGAHEYDPEDDYPVYAEKTAIAVRDNKGMGVIVCGSGVGVSVVANKLDGVRAAVAKNPDQIRAGRRDDDMNTLVLAADYTSESEAIDILSAYLNTEFSGEERHVRRLGMIDKIEKENK